VIARLELGWDWQSIEMSGEGSQQRSIARSQSGAVPAARGERHEVKMVRNEAVACPITARFVVVFGPGYLVRSQSAMGVEDSVDDQQCA
jgi:hypothetical protein